MSIQKTRDLTEDEIREALEEALAEIRSGSVLSD